MIISVPTEVKTNEHLVAITVSGVHELRRRGHRVLVQAGAGVGSGFADEDFAAAGAEVVFERCAAEPAANELTEWAVWDSVAVRVAARS